MTKCSYCNWPAEARCRKHKQYLCGRAYCIQLHRFGRGNCEYVEPSRFNWARIFLTVGASVAITATALAYAHWWRIS